MARGINKVILVGNLGADPDTRYMPSGDAVTNISLATTESWKDKSSGDQQERTEWHRVVIFNEKLGEIAQKYLQKGSKVYIEGQLATRKWTDQQGVEKYTTEVVLNRFRGELTMLDTRGGGGADLILPGRHGAGREARERHDALRPNTLNTETRESPAGVQIHDGPARARAKR